MNCLFCKIINGEIPCYKIYENEFTIAFLDPAQDTDGHILIIPKKHCENILDCDEITLSELMKTAKRISNHLADNCGYDGVNLLNASGKAAQQSINHFHIHIIPRKENDHIDAWIKLNGGKTPLKEMQNKLKVGDYYE